MIAESNPAIVKHVKGWIFDLYPSAFGQMSVWIIATNGRRLKLIDEFKPKIYISGDAGDLERLFTRFYANRSVAAVSFTNKYVDQTDTEKSKVLEVTLKDCRNISFLVNEILEAGGYLRYQVHNCDLKSTQAYLHDRDVFPLAFVETEVQEHKLRFHLLDSVETVNYPLPPLRIMKLCVNITSRGKVVSLSDPLRSIVLSQNRKEIVIDSGDERDKLLRFVDMVRKQDPDILVTSGGDSHLFPYLSQRASVNDVLDRFVLGRENLPLVAKRKSGITFFSYGRTYFRAPMRRLYGRVHIDEINAFSLKECGFDGLFEIARTCRVPLHRASRSSIGSSMSSLQLSQAVKDGVLIPRSKRIPEAFKSAFELLVGDRGGFVYEPRMGFHDWIGEVDFSSMYPSLMVKYNISAETVLCKCCPGSKLRFPELGCHICEKRVGIVPKVLKLVIKKRLHYKRLMKEVNDEDLRRIYFRRQAALKWILVTCFGYLGYKNAKFGTVDGHIGVCAFGREAFLEAARIAEAQGFSVIHGIVDSLWLKKKQATTAEYIDLCREVSEKVGVPLDFEGRYKWIVFLPSKMHPNVAVLNRYYGVKENGTIKLRGLEVRRRDTPKFVYDAQMDMIKVLAAAHDENSFVEKIPHALGVVKEYRERLLNGEISVWDLIVTRRFSKSPENYKQKISQVIAAEQLLNEGIKISAGKSIKFLFTSAINKRYERRVKAMELIENTTNPDSRKYLLLLYSAASNILSPFGYSAKEVYDFVRTGSDLQSLPNFDCRQNARAEAVFSRSIITTNKFTRNSR